MSEDSNSTEPIIEENGRTVTTDVIVGVAMMVLSVICAIAYSKILYTIYHDKELFRLTSYRFMFMLGVFDVIQCFPHFVTGIFTIFQSVGHPLIAKIMGVLATPCYVSYSVMTVILSINRFIQLLSPTLDRKFFAGKALYGWYFTALLFWLLYVIALGSPYAAIIYFPDWYSWDYDRSLEYSTFVQECEMYIEVGGIFISTFFYILVVILLYRKRKRFMKSKSFHVELKILIQASVITVYCTILNVFWHNYTVLLPATIWAYMALNFMWILNSGVYPVIYFVVNKALREKMRVGVGTTTLAVVSRMHRSMFQKETTETNKETVMEPVNVMKKHFDIKGSKAATTIRMNNKIRTFT